MIPTSRQPGREGRNLYNVKILRNFVLYLKERLGWNRSQLETLFTECDTHLSYIESDDNWFDQEFSDRFYNTLVRLTGDFDIAYKVGQYTLSEFSKGIAGRIIQGSFSPALTFRNIQKIAGAYTRGSFYEPILTTRGRAIIRSRVVEGCEERGYQCRNRLGMLESVISFFGCSNIKSEHKVCYHLGGPHCEYEFSWREPFRYRPIPAAFAIGLGAAISTWIIFHSALVSAAAAVQMSGLVYLVLNELVVKRLKEALYEQNFALEESVRIMSRRRDEQVLLRDIMKTTIEMRPIDQLCEMAVALIREKMQYDRVVLLLVDEAKGVLKVQASAGFESDLKSMVELAEFNLNPDNTQGFFMQVIESRKPLLQLDVQQTMTQLSGRSQLLLKKLGTQAFIAVPKIFKDKVLGILYIENTTSKRLDTNDRDLMASLSDHLAVAIANARSFAETAEALKRTRELEKQQREAKELFQKYVPSEIVDKEGLREDRLVFLESKRIGVMFTDIVGFTKLSENLPEQEVAEVVSIYVEIINEVVVSRGGRINKVIGDGLLIYFDPLHSSTVAAGHAIISSIVRINSRLAERGFKPIEIAVGAHRGVCTLGSIGYEKRLDYTVIGDAVNTAARIQEATRQWGTNLFCFSAALLDEAQEFQFFSRGNVALKGRSGTVEVFQMGEQAAVLKVA